MKERKAFLLRLDPRVLAAVKAWAREDNRSVNAQVEFLLRGLVQARKATGRARDDMRPSD